MGWGMLQPDSLKHSIIKVNSEKENTCKYRKRVTENDFRGLILCSDLSVRIYWLHSQLILALETISSKSIIPAGTPFFSQITL